MDSTTDFAEFEDAITRWTEAGLRVSVWPVEVGTGFELSKRALVLGNTRPGCEVFSFDGSLYSDAPTAIVFLDEKSQWVFRVSQGFGNYPGGFDHRFNSLSDLVADVLDYYFGDPAAMNPPELAERKLQIDSAIVALKERRKAYENQVTERTAGKFTQTLLSRCCVSPWVSGWRRRLMNACFASWYWHLYVKGWRVTSISSENHRVWVNFGREVKRKIPLIE